MVQIVCRGRGTQAVIGGATGFSDKATACRPGATLVFLADDRSLSLPSTFLQRSMFRPHSIKPGAKFEWRKRSESRRRIQF